MSLDLTAGRSGDRRGWWTCFLTLVLLFVLWIIATPLFAGTDEPGHVVRAAGMARGQYIGRDKFTQFGWYSEIRIPGTWDRLTRSAACFAGHSEVTPKCAHNIDPDPQRQVVFNPFGRYPPLPYLMYVPAGRASASRASVWAMRVLGALVCAAFLASALDSARRVGAWAFVGTAVALVPLTLYLGAIVNPSGLEIASAACLWATTAAIALGPRIDTRLLVRVAVAFVVFANARGLSLPMALLAVGAPMALATPNRRRELAANTAARRAAIAMGAGAVLALGWAVSYGRYRASPFAHADFTVFDGLHQTWKVFGEGIASFGFRDVRDWAAILITTALWGALVAVGIAAGKARERAVLLLVIALALVVPIVVPVLHPPPIYTNWQGRHGLPIWFGVPILAGAIASRRSPSRAPSRAVAATFACLLGLEQVTAFAVAARRYAVGAEGKLLYFLGPDWSGPVAPLVLLVAMLVASALLAWIVFIGAAPTRSEPPATLIVADTS